MRRTIFVCDKCGKEIDEVEATTYEIYNHDFCEKCALEASKVIKNWIAEVPGKKEVVAEAVKEVIEAEPKKRKGMPASIDWDKACALKMANWSNRDIANEIHASEGTINSLIYKKLADYKKGKRYNADDRPSEESDI